MTIRLIGACFIVLGCGSFGFIIAGLAKNEILALQNLVTGLEYMECELKYRITPLPVLCFATAKITKGVVSKFFELLGMELEEQQAPNVSRCTANILCNSRDMPAKVANLLEALGEKLGIFDLDGQVRVLESLRLEAEKLLNNCKDGHVVRLRGYKTIALCTGAAIVILLI